MPSPRPFHRVAWCFKEQRFPVVWPIVVLRVFSSVFFQAFDVASLNLLQVGVLDKQTRICLGQQPSCPASRHG
jgi:hypothetical protein